MSTNLKLITAGALALASFGAAAQVTLYGGGATLPANAYVGGGFYNQANPSGSERRSVALRNDPTGQFEGTLFGEVAQRGFGASQVAGISYCQTGSGGGRNAIIGTTAANVAFPASGSCPTFAGTPTGFGAPAGITDPDFAGSDAPLSLDEFNRGLTVQGAEHTQIVQFPYIAAAIAITFNNPDVPASTVINLNTTQVCGIFNGTINNWSQLNQPSKTIRTVYRSDSSGTTFSMTNWLARNCPVSAGFSTQSLWTAAISPLPAGALGASGNPGVANGVAANDGAIGYTEVADTALRAPTLRFANVNGRSPASLTSPTFTLRADAVIGPNDSSGRPTVQTIQAPVANCVYIADPNTYSAPANNYPIIGITNIYAYATGNRQTAAVRRLIKAPYTGSVERAATPSIGPGTGYAFIGNAQARTLNGRVNACVQ